MVIHRIALATEDELSEAVGSRLVMEMGPNFEIGLRLRKGGFGYLRSKLSNFCEMAAREPMLLITDLDSGECAYSLITDWMGKLQRPEKMLFRVAVREIESWLLADHDAMAALLKCSKAKLPRQPDELNDPKQTLLELAKKAPRDVRYDLIADSGAIASQGLGYNQRLGNLVNQHWDPESAAVRSNSLHRTRLRLRELAATLIGNRGRNA